MKVDRQPLRKVQPTRYQLLKSGYFKPIVSRKRIKGISDYTIKEDTKNIISKRNAHKLNSSLPSPDPSYLLHQNPSSSLTGKSTHNLQIQTKTQEPKTS
jgi:hypothetical protein